MYFSTFKIIDRLGRIVIPKELRSYYKILENDTLELVAMENGILVRKAAKKDDTKTKEVCGK